MKQQHMELESDSALLHMWSEGGEVHVGISDVNDSSGKEMIAEVALDIGTAYTLYGWLLGNLPRMADEAQGAR